jgi:hypothetical protein
MVPPSILREARKSDNSGGLIRLILSTGEFEPLKKSGGACSTAAGVRGGNVEESSTR